MKLIVSFKNSEISLTAQAILEEHLNNLDGNSWYTVDHTGVYMNSIGELSEAVVDTVKKITLKMLLELTYLDHLHFKRKNP